MSAAPPQPRSVGLLVPASNRVMEGDFIRWSVADGLLLHVNRLQAPQQRPHDMRANLAALSEGVDEATRLLALAAPDVVAFGCTSGSFLRGRAWDRQLRDTIVRQTGGKPAVTTASAVVDALHALGAHAVAVVTPYPAAVNALMAQYLADSGFRIVALRSTDGWETGNISSVPPATVLEMARAALAGTQADALFVSCTNLRAAELVHEIEAQCQQPVVTANQATYWATLRALGRRANHAMLGRLAIDAA
jgi:maleate isomerase